MLEVNHKVVLQTIERMFVRQQKKQWHTEAIEIPSKIH